MVKLSIDGWKDCPDPCHMKTRFLITAAFLLPATIALAHSGVKDPQVLARMEGMKQIAADMKILGEIAKGTAEFDASVLQSRSQTLAAHASEIEALFEAKATDPKSEAIDAIWSDWGGFLAKANAMETAAAALADVSTKQDFDPAFQTLGETCTACHEAYRIKN